MTAKDRSGRWPRCKIPRSLRKSRHRSKTPPTSFAGHESLTFRQPRLYRWIQRQMSSQFAEHPECRAIREYTLSGCLFFVAVLFSASRRIVRGGKVNTTESSQCLGKPSIFGAWLLSCFFCASVFYSATLASEFLVSYRKKILRRGLCFGP